MGNVTYIGYHATKRENLNEILNNGYKISISVGDTIQWLGNGVYFWLDDYYAVEWNLIKAKSNNKKVIMDNYTILESEIVCDRDKILDLSSPEGSLIYKELVKGLKNILINSGQDKYIDDIDNSSDKFKIDILQDYGLLDDFDIVLATFRKKKIKKGDVEDNFNEWEQRQICVRNICVIEKTNEYKDVQRINQLFNIITKNRKNIRWRVIK